MQVRKWSSLIFAILKMQKRSALRAASCIAFCPNIQESCADTYVYPLAASFADFMRLILACGSANPVEQIAWMDQAQFEQHLKREKEAQTLEQKALLSFLARALELTPMAHPFESVKALQADFDGSKIQYRDAYYDVLGIPR